MAVYRNPETGLVGNPEIDRQAILLLPGLQPSKADSLATRLEELAGIARGGLEISVTGFPYPMGSSGATERRNGAGQMLTNVGELQA